MNNSPTTVLLIEYDHSDARLIEEALLNTSDGLFQVKRVTRLVDAFELLSTEVVDVVLLDLALLDTLAAAVFDRILQAAPDALIIMLCTAHTVEAARLAMQRGAHDFIVKDHIDAHWLPRVLCHHLEHKVTQSALQHSEARFRAMSDASPLGIFLSDVQGACVYSNVAYYKISGLTFEQTLGTNWGLTIHPEDRQRVLAEWHAATQDKMSFKAEFRILQETGASVWVRVSSAAMGDDQMALGHVLIFEDISERKSTEAVLRAAEQALFEEKERAQVTLNSIGDAVLSTDIHGNLTYLNLEAEVMTGWSCAEALGRPLEEVFTLIDGNTRQAAPNPAQRAIDEDRTVGLAMDSVLVRRDGVESQIEDSAAPIHNRDGQVAGAVIVFHDISKSQSMVVKMSHLAQHDFLTGLPNRLLLTERLSQAIGLVNRHHKQVALLFLDLDYFKHVNDSLGHAIGDRLLQLVADRLVSCVRATDTVCRQGGDEFVILLAEIEHAQDAAQIAEKIQTEFTEPLHIGAHEIHVTLSIGISICPSDGHDEHALMQNADTAMYHAKANGRNNYQFFTAEMSVRAVRRQFVEGSLRRALKENEFLLYYQPKIDLASGAMIGSEALIRWQDPDLGLVYPTQFVSIAEECGLIVPIGRWVLREACRQVKSWLDRGLPAVPVAVNISALEFTHKGFVEAVEQILNDTGLAPHYLEIELTESLLMHDAESSVSVLAALKAMGISLAMDDFGTGYSSLSYLKRFPIDTLKIDQSLVRDIATNVDDASIVNAVISMGKSLKQHVVAEGVETYEQLTFLQSQHCDQGQGFHFSHPLPAVDFALLLVAANEVPPPGIPS